MNVRGEPLLSAARLSQKKHARICGSDLFSQGERPADGRTPTNDAFWTEAHLYLPPKIDVFPLQPLTQAPNIVEGPRSLHRVDQHFAQQPQTRDVLSRPISRFAKRTDEYQVEPLLTHLNRHD